MDPKRLKEAYRRLDSLDERLTYKIRPRSASSMVSPTADQVDAKVRELAGYTIELKEIVREFLLAFASRPPADKEM